MIILFLKERRVDHFFLFEYKNCKVYSQLLYTTLIRSWSDVSAGQEKKSSPGCAPGSLPKLASSEHCVVLYAQNREKAPWHMQIFHFSWILLSYAAAVCFSLKACFTWTRTSAVQSIVVYLYLQQMFVVSMHGSRSNFFVWTPIQKNCNSWWMETVDDL